MTFGKYLLVDTVSQTAHGSISTARLVAGGAAIFVVKQYRSAEADPDEPHWDCQHFLDRARAQKSIVASGGRYWAPIHDMGITPQGAWVVTDYLPLSVQKLIVSRMELHVSELHHIVDSVVRGLVELQQVRRRAHGGLKPANVLIAAGSDLASSKVLLTDPAQGISEGEPGDVFALGNLIHELVLHRPYAGPAHWPLAAGSRAGGAEASWNNLGRDAARWRELCSAMLAPRPESRPSLVELSHSLRELTPRKHKKTPKRQPPNPPAAEASIPRIKRKRKLRKRYLLIPAMAACIAVAGLAVLAFATISARRQVAQAKAGWIDAFARAVRDPQRRARYRNDPDLKIAIDDLDQSGLAALPIRTNLGSDLDLANLRQMRQASETARRLKGEVSPGHWHRIAALVAMQQKYQSRGWTQPAGYLSQLIVAAQPRPGAAVADAIDRIFNVQRRIEAQDIQVEKRWSHLDAAARQLEQRHDRLLQSFARGLRASASKLVTLSDSGFHGLDQLGSDISLADQIADATRYHWPGNIDTRQLAENLSARADLINPTPATMRLWLASLPLYSIRVTETAIAAAELRKRLKEVDETVATEGQSPAERDEFDHDRKEAAAQIGAFGHTPFIEKEFEDGAFATRRDGLASQVDLLRKYSRPQTASDLIKALPSVSSASQRINQYWDAWKKAQLARGPAQSDGRARIASLKVEAQTLRTTLADVDRQFPPVPKDLSDAFRAAARKHRDRAIARLLNSISPKSPQVDALKLASEAASYGEWCGTLHELARDFPIKKQFITADDRPDEQWSLQESFWTDPDIQSLVKPDLRRLAALRELAGASRAALARTADSAQATEVAFEAWRQLGENRIQPPWPATAAELATEAHIRERLAGMLAKIDAKSDRSAALAALTEQGPFRWVHAADQARSETELAAAWNARAPFGVKADQLDVLAPNARYNLWLWRTTQDANANNSAELSHDLDQLRQSAVALKSRPAPAALLAALARDAGTGPFGRANPGERFKVALAGVQPPVEFKRVEPPHGRPFYLCTTDVSLAEFVAVVDASGAWDQCRRLPWAYRPGQPDTRRGPRVWEWTDGPFAKFAPPQLWLSPDSANDFAPGLRARRFNRMVLSDAAGGMPSGQHPMQQISAEAALWFAKLCGCRLPTSREWIAAYQQYESAAGPEQWNLRDRTWQVQREYASGGNVPDMGKPVEDGAFGSGEFMAASMGGDGRGRSDTDGALFFRPVNAPGGAVFAQLVGNVAQYVCDASSQFEALAPKSPPEAIAGFVRQSPHRLYVIGGSALSPPELPITRPLAVAHPDQGYADVGFRLAFTAPPRSLAERVRWALQGRHYLWPA